MRIPAAAAIVTTTVVVLALAVAPLSAAAQGAPRGADTTSRAGEAAESFVHESWTVRDGLPVNAVTALLQSRDGYIWIATFDGLARFDGVRFTVFNSANSEGLPTNRIVQLSQARDGALWLLTEPLQLVRFRDGAFVHFDAARGLTQRVFAVYEAPDDVLWIGTEEGVGIIRGERFEPVAGVRGHVRAITGRADGSTWVGTEDGRLFRIANGRATALATDGALAGEPVLSLYEDPRRTLWIGTGGGVWRWDDAPTRILRTENYRTVGFRASPSTGEVWVQTPSRVYRLTDGQPTLALQFAGGLFGSAILFPDDAGRMLYAAGPELHREGRRLYTLDPAGAESAAGSGATWISAALLDHEGSLWLGTRGVGLHRLKPAPFRVYALADGLADRNVYAVHEGRDGAVWVGSFAGHVSRIDGEHVTNYRAASVDEYWIRSLLTDRAGRLWVGGATGLRVCALPAMSCARPAPDPIGSAGVLAMHEDASGARWFGTEAGLYRLDTLGWHRVAEAEGAPAFPVRAFRQTRDGALWMGTAGGGLSRLADGRFRHVTVADGLPFDGVRSLHEDTDGWLWVGTEGRGLARLDPRQWAAGRAGGGIVAIGARDGLFDEVIHQILEDDVGRLWMSSNRGIFWVARRDLLDFAEGRLALLHSTAYTERDGLRNREANGGSQPAGMRSRDGRLWFPTQDGVAVVDPARILQNRVPPNVVVEQVAAGGAMLRPDTGALALGTAQRDLEITYTALSFLSPGNVRFRYRLDPYDADWVDAGSRRSAFYTRVPPGRYTFRVMASNNDGAWNEQGAAVTLQLAPHPWETGWFRLLALLALGLLALAGVQWRVHSLRASTRQLGRLVDERTRALREHEVELERRNAQLAELHEARSRLFANLSHELRTPLTLILGPLRSLLDGRHGALEPRARAQHQLMLPNAERLLRRINQILDLARNEAEGVTLERETRDLVAFTRAATVAFGPLAEQGGVALRFHAAVPDLPLAFDAEQLEKALHNLLSNALKFTEAGGAVEVQVTTEADMAVLRVRDDGAGIAPAELPRVFDRFYRGDGARGHAGTGIGLSLARELVELHGGTIEAGSVLGTGSTFTVRLPRDQRMLAPAAWLGDAGAASGPRPAADHPWPDELVADDPPADDAGEAGIGTGAPRAPADGDRTTVLVVDDNADVRRYVRSILEPRFRVLEAADGQRGLEVALAALPDLIVADVMMPGMDGLALGRALKDDPMTDAIPFVLLTARAAPEDHVAGLGSGADVYLVKPFDPAVLEATVTSQLAQRHRLRERFRLGDRTPPALTPAPAATPPSLPAPLELRLRPLIVERLHDPAFGPHELASAAGLSYHQLYRSLRAELGTTPSRFIRGVRAECAAELLREGAGTVTEIAYAVGFESLSYFRRAFRERFGDSPSAHRAAAPTVPAPTLPTAPGGIGTSVSAP